MSLLRFNINGRKHDLQHLHTPDKVTAKISEFGNCKVSVETVKMIVTQDQHNLKHKKSTENTVSTVILFPDLLQVMLPFNLTASNTSQIK